MALFQRDLGTRVTATAGTTTFLDIVPPPSAGETVVVFVGTNAPSVVVTDVSGISGVTFATVLSVVSGNRSGVVLVSTPFLQQNPDQGRLTITFATSVAAKAMRAVAFRGLQAPPAELSGAAAGSGATADSGAIAAQTDAIALVLGLLVTDGLAADAFALTNGHTALGGVFNTATANVGIQPTYRQTSAVAQQRYQATITSRSWACGLAYMRAVGGESGQRKVGFAGAELAEAHGGGRVAFVGAEAALATRGGRLAFVGAEVAFAGYVPPPVVPRRAGPRVLTHAGPPTTTTSTGREP